MQRYPLQDQDPCIARSLQGRTLATVSTVGPPRNHPCTYQVQGASNAAGSYHAPPCQGISLPDELLAHARLQARWLGTRGIYVSYIRRQHLCSNSLLRGTPLWQGFSLHDKVFANNVCKAASLPVCPSGTTGLDIHMDAGWCFPWRWLLSNMRRLARASASPDGLQAHVRVPEHTCKGVSSAPMNLSAGLTGSCGATVCRLVRASEHWADELRAHGRPLVGNDCRLQPMPCQGISTALMNCAAVSWARPS